MILFLITIFTKIRSTIPLTVVTELGGIKKDNSMLFCGFGVGLSWGTFYTKMNNDIFCSKLIEV